MQLSLGVRPDTARFSECGTYRYNLTRELGGERPLVICGLNPSIATAVKNDRTIRKEVGFANRWGLGRLVKVNAYGFVAQFPVDMKRAAKSGVDIIGPDNDEAIRLAAGLACLTDGIFLAAWGANIEPKRQADLWSILRFCGVPIMCLGTNKDGTPEHPLYIPYERPLREWRPPT